jgi:hypothetical protein
VNLLALLTNPGQGQNPKINTRGFMANVHYDRMGVGDIGLDASGTKGNGAGARIGWGFGRDFTGFLGISEASLAPAGGGSYRLGQLNVGGVYSLFPPRTPIVPYFEFALSRVAIASSTTAGRLTQSGTGFSFGAGFHYFFARFTALQVELSFTPVSFSDAVIDGTRDRDSGRRDLITRFLIGITWYPRKKT